MPAKDNGNEELEKLEMEMKNMMGKTNNDELKKRLEKKLNDAKEGKSKPK